MSPIAPEIFKAYDIRGIVDRTLTEPGVEAVGRALGTIAHGKGVKKFVIGRDGDIVARFSPDTTPDDAKLVAAIEGELAKEPADAA